MNVERMHAVARRLADDLAQTRLPELIDQLHTALTNAVNSPQDANQQNQVSSLRTQVESALESSGVDEFSPVEMQVLQEWGITHLVGSGLRSTIDRAFVGNQITLATARDELGELVEPLSELRVQLAALIESLKWFGIGDEDLAAGEFEVDVLIPREAVRNELGALGEELQRLQDLLLPFVELATGSRPAIEVRTIGSSDFTVFLMAMPAAAACIAKAVEKVLDVYKRIMDIRLVKAQIEALDLPEGDEAVEAAASPLEDYAASMMAREVETIASELVSEYAVAELPSGRPNELQIEIRRSLIEIAGRIDDRYNISVRTGPIPELPAEGDDGEEGAEVGEENDLVRLAREVQAGRDEMQFMNLTGSPILGLASDSEGSNDGGPSSSEDAAED